MVRTIAAVTSRRRSYRKRVAYIITVISFNGVARSAVAYLPVNIDVVASISGVSGSAVEFLSTLRAP